MPLVDRGKRNKHRSLRIESQLAKQMQSKTVVKSNVGDVMQCQQGAAVTAMDLGPIEQMN